MFIIAEVPIVVQLVHPASLIFVRVRQWSTDWHKKTFPRSAVGLPLGRRSRSWLHRALLFLPCCSGSRMALNERQSISDVVVFSSKSEWKSYAELMYETDRSAEIRFVTVHRSSPMWDWEKFRRNRSGTSQTLLVFNAGLMIFGFGDGRVMDLGFTAINTALFRKYAYFYKGLTEAKSGTYPVAKCACLPLSRHIGKMSDFGNRILLIDYEGVPVTQ